MFTSRLLKNFCPKLIAYFNFFSKSVSFSFSCAIRECIDESAYAKTAAVVTRQKSNTIGDAISLKSAQQSLDLEINLAG